MILTSWWYHSEDRFSKHSMSQKVRIRAMDETILEVFKTRLYLHIHICFSSVPFHRVLGKVQMCVVHLRKYSHFHCCRTYTIWSDIARLSIKLIKQHQESWRNRLHGNVSILNKEAFFSKLSFFFHFLFTRLHLQNKALNKEPWI